MIYLFESIRYTFSGGNGTATNNLANFFAIHMVLNLAIHNKVKLLQVLKDSLLVIDWLNNEKPPKYIYLKSIFEDICRLLILFYGVTFHHIYRE